jgi:hypothetical protein
MSRLHPEYPDSESSYRWLPADILLREEPEGEEEDEEEQDVVKMKTATMATRSDWLHR